MEKVVYFTIDDCPSKDFRKKIDFLISQNIKAILFCRGDHLEKFPEDIIYAIKHEFIIGNHSYSHPHFVELSVEKCFNEIQKTDKIIEEIYKKAGIKRPINVFRFPYGDMGEGDKFEKKLVKTKKIVAIQNFLKKLGYKQPKFSKIEHDWYKKAKFENNFDVAWTFDVMEWGLKGNYGLGINSIKDVFDRIDKSKELNSSTSNEIIIMHDHIETTEYFEQIIKRLIEKGLKFEMPKI